MALGKLLNLGGMDNRPPKTDQSVGSFRVARNVFPLTDGRIVPRNPNNQLTSGVTGIRAYHQAVNYPVTNASNSLEQDPNLVLMTSYNGGTLGAERYRFYNMTPLGAGTLTTIPNAVDEMITPYALLDREWLDTVQTTQVGKNIYFLSPYTGWLAKYDGVHITEAGVNQPVIAGNNYFATGAKFFRVLNHTYDFNNVQTDSEYVQYPVAIGLPSYSLTLTGQSNVINVVTSTTGEFIQPKTITRPTNGEENMYIASGVTWSTPNMEFTVTVGSNTTITSDRVGSYILVKHSRGTSSFGFPENYAIALRIKRLSGSDIFLDGLDAKYLDIETKQWITSDLNSAFGAAMTAILVRASNILTTLWAAPSENGIYILQMVDFAFPYITGGTSYTRTFTVADPPAIIPYLADNFMLTPGNILNQVYDVTSKKISPNSAYPFSPTGQSFSCMTQYQGLLILANDDLIWYSDTTLGGSFEQLEALAFIKVGDFEAGRITSICATSDFLFVGRERKNYYVLGNISTGNYRVQEITQAELGPWNNTSSINVLDSVIFFNSQGVYQLTGGAQATTLSEKIPKNFYQPDGFGTNNEDVAFVVNYPYMTRGGTAGLGWPLRTSYDEVRSLLTFHFPNTGNALVLNVKTGEFYEWEGLLYGATINSVVSDIFFYDGNYLLGIAGQLASSGFLRAEYKISSPLYDYSATYPIKLYSTWLTAGEPSLQKCLLQLKIFGRIQPKSATVGINVCHYKDWDVSTKITNVPYIPNSLNAMPQQIQYSHKKRFNSDKVLSSSVGIEINESGSVFEIESFEVEFNPIQDGVKK